MTVGDLTQDFRQYLEQAQEIRERFRSSDLHPHERAQLTAELNLIWQDMYALVDAAKEAV